MKIGFHDVKVVSQSCLFQWCLSAEVYDFRQLFTESDWLV